MNRRVTMYLDEEYLYSLIAYNVDGHLYDGESGFILGEAGNKKFTGVFNRISAVHGQSSLSLSFSQRGNTPKVYSDIGTTNNIYNLNNTNSRMATIGAIDVRYGGSLDFSLRLGGDVLGIKATAAGCCVPRAEEQTITCTALSSSGGSYDIGVNCDTCNTTTILSSETSSSSIETRLEQLQGITDVSVSIPTGTTVCNSTGGTIIISFSIVEPHKGDIPLLFLNSTNLNGTVTIMESVKGSLGASSSLPGEMVEVIDDVVTSCYGVDATDGSGNTTLTCSVTKISSPLFVPIADDRGLMISQYIHTCMYNYIICQHSSGNVVGDRVIEIYNPHCGNAIDLSVYSVHILQRHNIGSWNEAVNTIGATKIIQLSGTMLGKETLTLCNYNSSNTIKSNCNLVIGDSEFNFDGTLAIALVKQGEVVDSVGDPSSSSCVGTIRNNKCIVESELHYRSMFITVANQSSYGTLWGHSISRIGRVISPQPSWIISSGISRATSEWSVEKTVQVTDVMEQVPVDRKEIQNLNCQADSGKFILQYNNQNTTSLSASSATENDIKTALMNIGLDGDVRFQSNYQNMNIPCSSQLNGYDTRITFSNVNGDQPNLITFSDNDDPLKCNDRTENEIQTLTCTADSGIFILSSSAGTGNEVEIVANNTNRTEFMTHLNNLGFVTNVTYISSDHGNTLMNTLCGSGLSTTISGTIEIEFFIRETMTGLSITTNVASSSTSTTITHAPGSRAFVVGDIVTVSGHSDSMTGLSVTSSVASSSTSTTVTHVAGARQLVVGDTVTISGHTGDAANIAMNQVFTVASVTSATVVVLTGTEMTPATYTTGTIVAAVGNSPATAAMNQAYTVASVASSTEAVLTGTGMTANTYSSGTIIATVAAPSGTIGNVPMLIATKSTNPSNKLIKNDNSDASITISETVRGVINSNLCKTNVPVLGMSITTVVNGIFGNVDQLKSSSYELTSVQGVVGGHDSEDCRYRLNNYEACEYLDPENSVELQYKKPLCKGRLPEDCSYKNQQWKTFQLFNNTVHPLGEFIDVSVDIPVEARSWGTKFRFYQPTFGDNVMEPKYAEFLVNAYMTEAFNLATKDCWGLRDVKFTSNKRVLCTQNCPVVAGVQEITDIIIIDDGDSGTLSFSPSNSYNFTEPVITSDAVITVTRKSGTSKDITFRYEIMTSSGTAVVGRDYQDVGRPVLSMSDGVDVKTFNITVVADAEYENPDEYFVVRLLEATNGARFENGVDFIEAYVYIKDDGDCKVSFGNNTFSVLENVGIHNVPLERIGGLDKSVTCDVSILGFGQVGGGTATADVNGQSSADYKVVTPKSGDTTLSTITFDIGEKNTSVAVQIINEFPVLYENPDETINFKIVSCVGASIDATATEAVVIIVDDGDAGTIQLLKANFAPNENDGVVAFPVSRLSSSGSSNASYCCSGVVQVKYKTIDGTATLADSDYSVSEGTLLFNDQETSKNIFVEIKNDLKIEIPDEYFSIKLTSVELGGLMGTIKESIVTIIDDGDASTVQFLRTSRSIIEKDVLTTITIERSGNMEKLLNFTWHTKDDTATAISDYVPIQTGYAWAGPNVNETTIVIRTLQDDHYEGLQENFSIVLGNFTEKKSADEAVIGVKNSITINILDDQDVSIEFQNTTISEKECECSILVTMTRLSAPGNERPSHFGVEFSDNLGTTTSSGSSPDFTVPVSTFIMTNETIKTFEIRLHQNTVFNDPNKYMIGQLYATTNTSDTIMSVTDRSTIRVNILDDGDAGIISLKSNTFSVSEGENFATITLVRTGGTSGVATVEVRTKEVIEIPASVDGGGYCGYWSYIGCTTICNVTVVSQWDMQPESIVLTEMFDYCMNAKDTSITDYSQSRKDCFDQKTNDELNVLHCGIEGVAPTVTDARGALASTGRCTSGTDYVPQTISAVVFPSGQPEVTHTISLRVDNIYEAVDEKFAVIISNTNPTAVLLGNFTTALFTIEDDGDANIVFSNETIDVKEDLSYAMIPVRRYIRNLTKETIVGYRLNRETATCCINNVASGATITILRGMKHNWIQVPVTNDLIYQPPPQNLKVYLEKNIPSAQYTLVPSLPELTMSLVDDGDSGTISFDRSAYYVNESEPTLTITVVRKGTNSGTASVVVSTSNVGVGGYISYC